MPIFFYCLHYIYKQLLFLELHCCPNYKSRFLQKTIIYILELNRRRKQ